MTPPKRGGYTKDLAEVATPAETPNPTQITVGEVFALPKQARRQIHRLISKVEWPKGGRVNDSSTRFFGAKSDTLGTTVTKLTTQEREINENNQPHADTGDQGQTACMVNVANRSGNLGPETRLR